MTLTEFFSNTLAVSILSLLAGALITAIATKIHAKTAVFRYSTRVERVAMAADDRVFGTVRVSWHDQDVRNLHLVSIEIENASTRDFENVPLNVYPSGSTIMLNERTAVVNTPYIVKWAPEFAAMLAVAPGSTPTQGQWDAYNHSREYLVPVFNRGQVLELSYLCTRPDSDEAPYVFVSTQLKGVVLKLQVRSNFVLGVPVQVTLPRGLIVAIVAVAFCTLWLNTVWLASLIGVVVGLFAQFVGALVYKVERWLRKLIAG